MAWRSAHPALNTATSSTARTGRRLKVLLFPVTADGAFLQLLLVGPTPSRSGRPSRRSGDLIRSSACNRPSPGAGTGTACQSPPAPWRHGIVSTMSEIGRLSAHLSGRPGRLRDPPGRLPGRREGDLRQRGRPFPAAGGGCAPRRPRRPAAAGPRPGLSLVGAEPSVVCPVSRAQGGLSASGQVLTAARAKAAPSVFGDPSP